MLRGIIKRFGYLACALIGCAVVWAIYAMTGATDEVALTLGQPYEQVREQSRATLPPVEHGSAWSGHVSRPAQFRLTDRHYGFTTPAAKFLNVGYDRNGKVWSVTLSPQVETLPLDQTLKIALDLQEQLRRHGWQPVRPHHFPPISDTPDMVERIRRGDDPRTVWRAASKYEVAIDVRRFVHEDRPEDERYLITLELTGPTPTALSADDM